jgi:hypothetical protein
MPQIKVCTLLTVECVEPSRHTVFTFTHFFQASPIIGTPKKTLTYYEGQVLVILRLGLYYIWMLLCNYLGYTHLSCMSL